MGKNVIDNINLLTVARIVLKFMKNRIPAQEYQALTGRLSAINANNWLEKVPALWATIKEKMGEHDLTELSREIGNVCGIYPVLANNDLFGPFAIFHSGTISNLGPDIFEPFNEFMESAREYVSEIDWDQVLDVVKTCFQVILGIGG